MDLILKPLHRARLWLGVTCSNISPLLSSCLKLSQQTQLSTNRGMANWRGKECGKRHSAWYNPLSKGHNLQGHLHSELRL